MISSAAYGEKDGRLIRLKAVRSGGEQFLLHRGQVDVQLRLFLQEVVEVILAAAQCRAVREDAALTTRLFEQLYRQLCEQRPLPEVR